MSLARIDVPLINIKDIASTDNDEACCRIGNEILNAGNEFGILAIENHGISIEKINEFFHVAENFLSLKQVEKEKYTRTIDCFHGYATVQPPKYDGSPMDHYTTDESFDIWSFDYEFPEEVPELKTTAIGLQKDMEALGEKLARCLDKALGANGYLIDSHSLPLSDPCNNCNMKIIKYPAVPSNVSPGSVRLKEHIDVATITLLYIDDGFQIQDKSGNWKVVNVPTGSFVIVFGMAMNIFSSGRLWPVHHRVVVTEKEDLFHGPRYTLAYFMAAQAGYVIKHLDGSSEYTEPAADLFMRTVKVIFPDIQ